MKSFKNLLDRTTWNIKLKPKFYFSDMCRKLLINIATKYFFHNKTAKNNLSFIQAQHDVE